MRLLDRVLGRRAVAGPRTLTARELEAKKLTRIMRSVAAQQIENPTSVVKRRHLTGLSLPGGAVVPARLSVSLTRGSLRNVDPWWHHDSVRRHYHDEELTEDRRVGNTDRYLVKTETRDITLLDGRQVKTIRKIYYDKKEKRHSKELLAQDESGRVDDYNEIPANLMGLDGLDAASITPDTDIVVTEGYPAADALRNRGLDAVAIISGTFDVPSERALDPLLKARHILLWPDNDSAGAFLMNGVAKALDKMGARAGQIKLVLWREGPRKGDAYDFTGDQAKLQALIDEAVVWSPDTRIATNSIQYLSVPRIPPQLRLDDRVRPPAPELLREPVGSGLDATSNDAVRILLNDESLTDEQKRLLEDLGSGGSTEEE